jgi:signal transduction histidine kinase
MGIGTATVMTRSLRLVTTAVAVLDAGAALLRLANPLAVPAESPAAAVPVLLTLAALIVVALVSSWAPTLAWAAIVAGSIAASVAVTAVMNVALDGHATPVVVIEATQVPAVLVPVVVAGAYAALGTRRPAIRAIAWLVAGTLSIGLAYRAILRAGGAELGGGLPRWAWLAMVAGLTALGLVRDLTPVLRRTRERLASDQFGAGSPGRSTDSRTAAAGALPALRVLVDELVPGRDVGRAAAAESERGRLAADLHAEVLPSLQRALAQAESGGSVERLAADLRSAVGDVESLLAARRSIVLEELGLLAGLEWLAERVEERSDVRVEIEVLGGDPGGGGDGEAVAAGTWRPPRSVERSAFRIAQLALDNVMRHAPTSRALVSVDISPAAVAMRIDDDGPGPPIDEASAARAGRRGIADMRAEARACGARLETGRAPGQPGMVVAFRWSGPGRAIV